MSKFLLAAILIFFCHGSTVQPLGAEVLTGLQIREIFSGNTASITIGKNPYFPQYHVPDGRVIGFRGKACWKIVDNAICYEFGTGGETPSRCFSVERSGALYRMRSVPDGQLDGIALVHPGDPHHHMARFPPWSCDEVISLLQREHRPAVGGRF